jgi:hypothetical protein
VVKVATELAKKHESIVTTSALAALKSVNRRHDYLKTLNRSFVQKATTLKEGSELTEVQKKIQETVRQLKATRAEGAQVEKRMVDLGSPFKMSRAMIHKIFPLSMICDNINTILDDINFSGGYEDMDDASISSWTFYSSSDDMDEDASSESSSSYSSSESDHSCSTSESIPFVD